MWLKDRVKAWLGPIWWYAAVMFVVQRAGDVINLYTGLWLIPKWVPQDQLGALLPLGQASGLLGLPLAIILAPFVKFVNTFAAKGETGKVKALIVDALVVAGVSALVIAAYTWATAPLVFERLRIHEKGLIWFLCGVAIISIFMPLVNNALQGLKLFRCYGLTSLTSAPMRLVLLFLLLPASALVGYFAAQFLMYIVMLGIGFWGLRHLFSRDVRRESYRENLLEMWRYTLPVAGMMAVGSVTTFVQYLVIRQRLPDVESAAFYFGSRFSEMPNIVWSAITVAFFPIVSEAFEKGRNTVRILVQVLAVTVLSGGAVALALGVGVEWLFGVVGRWKDYQPYAHLIVWMAMTNVFRVGFTCFSTHEMACRRFTFNWYAVPLGLLEAGVLISLTGYGFFVPYLPASWIDWMASLHAARLEFLVWVMFASSGLQFLGILVQCGMYGLRDRGAKPTA